MALVSLFIQTKAMLASLELDASLNENHEANAELTKSPVEDGATVSDNIVLLPRKLTLEGFVSKTPLGVAGLIGSAGSALAGQAAANFAKNNRLAASLVTTGIASLGGLVGSAVGGGLEGPKSREPSDIYDYLDELRSARIPFDIVTALKLYQSMALTALSAPRNSKTRGGLRFTATLEQVVIVRATTTTLSQVPGAGAAQNIGKQAPASPSAKTGNNASILYNVFGPG